MDNISSNIKINEIRGDISEGGWEMRFDVVNDTDLLAANQRIAVQWRPALGDTFGEMRTAFTGFVLPRRITFDGKRSQATYVAQTSNWFLRNGWMQGINFKDTDTDNRENYHQFDSVTGASPERMTMGRIVRHMLGYYDELGSPPASNPDWVSHTNMVYHASQNPDGWIRLDNVTLEPFDVATNPNGTMRVDHYIVKETTDMWKSLQDIARNEFFIVGFDKTDTLYYKRHPMFATSLPTPRLVITEEMIINSPVVDIRDGNQIRQLRLHAVTDEGDTLHANYPDLGSLPVQGKKLDISRIRCNDLTTLQQWANYRYKFETRDMTLRIQLPGLCGLLFNLLDRVAITYTGTSANGVHLDWTEKKFWIHEIAVRPDERGSGTSELLLEAENV